MIPSIGSRANGFTLIELIVAIVVISIATISAVGLTSAISTRSAQSLQRMQAVAIAQSYMQEVVSKDFGPVAGGANRSTYNDVLDYAAVTDASIRDHRTVLVPGLGNFRAQIRMQSVAWGAVPLNQSQLITVTVTDPSGVQTQLQAFKTAP